MTRTQIFAAIAIALKADGIAIADVGNAAFEGPLVPEPIKRALHDEVIDMVYAVQDNAFAIAYVSKYNKQEYTRGLSGFVVDKSVYTFDRTGVEDSWYPLDLFEKKPKWDVDNVVLKMKQELERGNKSYASLMDRKAKGTVVDFGPTKRTLLPEEIEKYKAALANRSSFSLTPSGFGIGYRFYAGNVGRTGKYGQHQPAAQAARQILACPTLVYDTMDCD